MEEPQVVLVDLQDRERGMCGKLDAHRSPMLHRAFSVFLYRRGELLLQQRAMGKYHCPGIWANTCCSHPYPQEDTAAAAKRRLVEETGIEHDALREIFAFSYYAPFDNGLYEYEYDHVFVGEYMGEPQAYDCEEIEQMAWVNMDTLLADMTEQPQKYAPWFLTAAPRVIAWIKEQQK